MNDNNTFLEDIVLGHALKTPASTALIHGSQKLSYAQLAKRVDALAIALQQAEIEKGDFVGTLVSPGLDISVALLAISRIGAVYMPLDPEHQHAHLLDRLEDVSARFLLFDEANRETAAELAYPSGEITALLHAGAIARQTVAPVARSLDDPACIFFTSGTTGKPKGVVGSFRAQRDSILEPSQHLGFGSTDCINSMARYAWSISMLELLAPLVCGGTSIIFDRSLALNFDRLGDGLQTCTAFHCPPALLKSFSLYLQSNPHISMDHIRLVWYGGDRLSIDSIRSVQQVFPAADVITAYGCTEIFGLSHAHRYERPVGSDKVLIGRPVGNMKQLLVSPEDSDAGNDSTDTGEIYLGGDRVALEYWNRPELTEQKFCRIEGIRYYRTGDYGRLDSDGNLEFVERRDAQVKIRGIRIELGEIEYFLTRDDSVSEAVVIAVDLDGESKELHAFIVFNQGAYDDLRALRERIRSTVPDYLLPAHFHRLDRLPLTENFKINRNKLLEHASRVQAPAQIIEHPLAKDIADIWEEAAGITIRSTEDRFFDVGGNSLSAAVLASHLSRHFTITVEVADIYRAPTLNGQTAIIEQRLQSHPAGANQDIRCAAQAQVGLVFRELFEKRPASITCTRYIATRPGFDETLVRKALLQLIERFPTLRTNLLFGKGYMRLSERTDISEDDICLQRQPGQWSEHGEQHQALIKHDFKFDIQQDVLIAGIISALDDGREVLQLTAHHIAADDNSMSRLAADFIELYDALLKGHEAHLLSFDDDYADFSTEQLNRIRQGDFDQAATAIGERLLEHYQTFADSPLLGNNHSDLFEHSHSSLSFAIGPDRQTFITCVAALAWALYHEFGRSAFVFCMHLAQQRNSETTPKVGMFVNLVPVFINIPPNPDFAGMLSATQHAFQAAMEHSNVPYELILSSTPTLKRLGSFPFDAFVNDLDFSDQYRTGYEALRVTRSFATDSRELSMSVIQSPGKQSIQLESPGFSDDQTVLQSVASNISDFISGLARSSL